MMWGASIRSAAGVPLLVAIFSLTAALPARAQVTLTAQPEQIAVDINGQPFTVLYLRGPNLNRPYLHPLRSASGRIVNRSFPAGQVPGERIGTMDATETGSCVSPTRMYRRLGPSITAAS